MWQDKVYTRLEDWNLGSRFFWEFLIVGVVVNFIDNVLYGGNVVFVLEKGQVEIYVGKDRNLFFVLGQIL